jgi:BolA protein
MESGLFARARQSSAFPDQTAYISEMSVAFTGPVADEITRRLTEALGPTQLRVTNDSARHHGHAGDDGSGESHFTVEIEAPLFGGMSRLQRQRAVNSALGDLLVKRIHALAIKARAPGE